MPKDNFIIYAAYGSNLLKERFWFYIYGGVYMGNCYGGCSDKTAPEDMGWLRIPHRLYFAKKSYRWGNKGVAFLTSGVELRPDFQAVVRLWKVKESQFKEIKEQEGNWYNRILDLGEKDGFLIKTFTGDHENDIQEPSAAYLEIIKQGLKETTGWGGTK
ncbi:MAG: hypothetical protein N3G18_05335, partial [Candidatus Saccharicenans sp.]|nr:hypothetical protein [Candidatus Saccharicenans sp.]